MPHRLLSCITAIVIAATSGTTAYVAYGRMDTEDQRNSSLITELENGQNFFVISGTASTPCYGLMNFELKDVEDQLMVDTSGWLKLTVGERTYIQEVSGELAFSPLGQLGASIVTAEVDGTSFSVGTMNINPITFKVVTGEGGKNVLFEQNVPGPVEIRKSGQYYRILAPSLKGILPLSLGDAASVIKLPFSVIRDNATNCAKENAQPLDVSNLAAKATLLRSSIQNLLSGPKP